jgi:frataxin-like iron-binding protein CyaY
MKKVYLGLSLFTLFSCGTITNKEKGKKYFADLLQDVDKVQLLFFNRGDTLSKIIVDQAEIAIYQELINGKRDPRQKIRCDSTGQIIFYNKEAIVMSAWFSSPASGSHYNKASVTYSVAPEHYGALLTYRSGRDIDDYYYKLRSTAIRTSSR